jgi:hypothetical protein
MFRVALDRPLGAKRGRGRGSFIDSVLDAVDLYYAEVMQHVKAWTATPPKVRESLEVPPVAPSLVSTALSSQDGSEAPSESPGPSSFANVADDNSNEERENDIVPPQWSEDANPER